MFKISRLTKLKGFTLIEMLVAVLIFAIIIGAISGVFISGLRSQRRALSTQEVLNQTSYALEYMSRAIRMARKQLPPTSDCSATCLSQNGLNYEISGNSDLRFQNYNCVCQRFFLEEGQLKEQKEWRLREGILTGGTTLPLTSANLKVNSLKFNLSGAAQPPADKLQPMVTIFLEIEGREKSKLKIQTSVSQRALDVKY